MEKVIKKLNKFLEGNYMAIHTYDQYIHHMSDPKIKKLLQNIQQSHKQHASIIAERIQNLGGIPANDLGMKGKMIHMISNIKGPTKDAISILKDASVGESRGIQTSKELLEGDLDPESQRLVQNILDKDQQHIELINTYIRST
ncbi:MAG TPA: DUF2383 domain-containing protein [Bacillus bacterium]|uniref:DUF2383 domain-containing protein n=1 Tax=Siminovitchia fordii TaxID=254759 RepID=A0ABQ4K3I2_9BACI|nr:DUF2383 domain-containing protein [Siminovitchia fordii]GIN19725.1 hypothetical protein J1TS3_08590 [Siminovitchia fordii]HBZ11371.1 DUF2383 domain-containing protein [Bacillus sp. (in: firmicutes)]